MWFSEATWFPEILESEQTWFIFHSSTSSRLAHDQSCHHETWLHLHFVDWSNLWNHQAHDNGLKELLQVLGIELQNVTSAKY